MGRKRSKQDREREAVLRRERGRRGEHLKGRYGISEDYYNMLLAAQGGVCAICKSASPANGTVGKHRIAARFFNVDHNHKDGSVRGLLCFSCNAGIGLFNDNADRLRAAMWYLNERSENE